MNDSPSQSALNPAGAGAEEIANLFYVMAVGAGIIWTIVIGVAIYALFYPGKHDARKTRFLVIGGGAVFPTVVLTALLTYGLAMLPELQRPAPEGNQVIEVAGVRWWWRVHYRLDDGRTIESANEIYLPVDEAVEFKLTSEDVIHAFWIPSLGGKTDMIPGRETRLKLLPNRPGTYRGVCAEFCGAAHTQMALDVVVVSREDFERYLNRLAQPADSFSSPGWTVFQRRGCAACHAIRGSQADGSVGPDLTHFGSRRSIGAATLPNTPDNLKRWITETHAVKPGVEMPAFETIEDAQLQDLVDFLGELQ
ncbi:cytochrome c oxidase subunit II [Roseimaritima ulvae]|uniref:Cytochrome aa3 subunit 2 n=1 Tax=Roseimaritima ulvae TaxID=980254 RepID=A0A5B9R0B0_9BACT|nr:cytochrome c oxidase subunit II [Roseimaritima ulvae]QEG43165.1 Cytochrome c oxidase subunit 2 precursor [Roseimaritima ulvae]